MSSIKSWKDRRAIITGGCGFLGFNLTILLVILGAQVTCVDSFVPEYGGNLFNYLGDQSQGGFKYFRCSRLIQAVDAHFQVGNSI